MIKKRFVFTVCASVIAAICIFSIVFHYYNYPNGFRAGKLSTFMGKLSMYAQEHDGWYPNGGTNAFASLQKLYPKYASVELSGMSGDESEIVTFLKSGRTIDKTVSSWVYHPGFRIDDNPEIAIIWERQEGIFINGSRFDGHAVGYANRGYDQIPSKDWHSFVKRQEELRSVVLTERASKTKKQGD